MTEFSDGDELLPPATDRTPIAGFWRRLAAFLIDGAILSVPALLLGLALFRSAAALGQAGRLIGFAVALLYFGLLDSRLGGGQTLGKRLLRIRVEDRAGNALSPTCAVLRFLIIAIPYFLNGLWLDVDTASFRWPEYLLGTLLIFVVFGGGGAIGYLFVFNRRTRQSLHDLAVDSFVVRGAPAVIPPGLSMPRLHMIVVGCWLSLALIAPGVGIWVVRQSDLTERLQPLVELQTAIRAQNGIRHVSVTAGITTIAMIRGGTSTTSFLQVQAQQDVWRDAPDIVATSIAGTVLEHHPDLLGREVLVVQVQRGFDLGIAYWRRTYRDALGAAAWQVKLAQLRALRGGS